MIWPQSCKFIFLSLLSTIYSNLTIILCGITKVVHLLNNFMQFINQYPIYIRLYDWKPYMFPVLFHCSSHVLVKLPLKFTLYALCINSFIYFRAYSPPTPSTPSMYAPNIHNLQFIYYLHHTHISLVLIKY